MKQNNLRSEGNNFLQVQGQLGHEYMNTASLGSHHEQLGTQT